MKQQKPLFYGLFTLMILLVCFAYAHHFHNPFHFDDEHTIVTNSYIRDIKNIPLFFKDATTFSSLPANQAWRPGISTLDAIDFWWAGKPNPEPFWFHVHIFIDYLILSLFIYLFAVKIFELSFKNDLNPYIALLTTAVFMLHTGNAETINYIISRSDSDSTLMIMITLCVFVYYQNLRKYMLYLIPMFIGFMIKEPTVMVGPLAFLFIFFFEENMSLKQSFEIKKDLKILLAVLPMLLLAVGLFWFSQAQTPGTHTLGGTDRWAYLITEPFVMVHYVGNYFFPFDLSADTDWGLVHTVLDQKFIVGTLFILFTLGLAYWASLDKKSRPIAYGILWFYLALVPTSTIVPFSEVLNDHRVFFPYIGLTIAFVWALFLLYKKYEKAISESPLLTLLNYVGIFAALLFWTYGLYRLVNTNSFWNGCLFAAILITTLFIAWTFRKNNKDYIKRSAVGMAFIIALFLAAHIYGVRVRSHIWGDEDLLWKDVTIKSPHNGRGLMNYGLVLMGRGDNKGALEYYTRAKEEWPYYSYIYINLGVLNSVMGNMVESEKNFKYGLALNAQNPNAYFYYAIMLRTNGRIPEALAMVNKGLELSPREVDLLRLKTELTTSVQDKIKAAEKAAKDSPSAENYLNLSLVYYNNAQYMDCVHAAEEAAKLNPKYDAAYNNICSAYNMLHDWDDAIAAGKKAVELNPNNQQAKNNLQVSLNSKNSIVNAENLAHQKPSAENYLNLSLAYYNEARYLDCVHACEEALKLRPNYDLAYNNICSSYNALHQWDNAIAAGNKAIQINPNNQQAKNNLQVSLDGKKSGK